jgi:glucokinase
MLLAGDIGGTKTVLAVFSPAAGPREPQAQATFPSAQYESLEAIVQIFLEQVNLPVERAAFGVAGPVRRGRSTITNLPWVIDEAQLQQALNLRSVRLLNDLESVAYAVPALEGADLHTLNLGEPDPSGAIAVIAPGTGLGEAFLTRDEASHRAHASEGGHADFAPTNLFEIELLHYLRSGRGFEHVSYERVCSGIGIPNIYAYLKDSGYADEPEWLAERLATAPDPTPVIVNAALHETPPPALCAATLNAFVAILGSEAGNLALKVLATGGVYLGGGIPPRILAALTSGRFMEAFRRKGRFAELMERMPIHVILNPKVALLGVARFGLELWDS